MRNSFDIKHLLKKNILLNMMDYPKQNSFIFHPFFREANCFLFFFSSYIFSSLQFYSLEWFPPLVCLVLGVVQVRALTRLGGNYLILLSYQVIGINANLGLSEFHLGILFTLEP